MAKIPISVILTAKDKASRKLRKFGGQLKKSGIDFANLKRKAMLASAAMAGLGTAVVSIGKRFDTMMKKSEAIAEAQGYSAEEIDKLRKVAIEFGKDGVYSANQIAGAMQDMVSDGLEPAVIVGGHLEAVMDAATASGREMAEMQIALSDTMQQFRAETDETTKFADVFTNVLTNTPIVLNELANTLTYLGPAASTAGMSVEEAATAMATLGQMGIRGSKAGTALRTTLRRLVRPEVVEQMEEYGVQIYDTQGQMRNFQDILLDFKEGMADLTDEQRQQAAISMFGARAFGPMLKLIEEADGSYNELAEAIERTGTAQEIAEKQQNTWSASLTRIRNKLETLAVIMSEDLAPILGAMANKIEWLIGKLNEMDVGTRKVIIVVGAFVVALGPLLVALSTLIWSIGVIAPLISGLAVPIGIAIAAIASIIISIRNLRKSFEFWKQKIQEVGQKMADIVDWIIRKVNEITGWLSRNWGDWGIHLHMPNFDWVKDKVNSIRDWLNNAWGNWGVNLNFGGGGGGSWQHGGLVPGPVGAPQPAIVHGGERIIPTYQQGEQTRTERRGSNTEVNLNVHIGMYAGSATEKREIARRLWQEIGNVAKSQNKSPDELLGMS